MFAKEAPLLDDIERQSAVWKKIKQHLEQRLAALREKNDKPTLDAERTAFIRGQIRELKNLAALDLKPAPQKDADDPFKD